MAKDDYFVVAYRVLKYLYECFKAGEEADVKMFDPDALGINNGYWVNLIESLSNEGYVVGFSFPSAIGSSRGVKVGRVRITEKGIEFLQENTLMKKAENFLKGVKDVIPGL